MTKSITTSIRLSPKLKDQVDYLSSSLHVGRNSIITKALEEFISKNNYASLAEEARRQSLIASKSSNDEGEIWEKAADCSNWEN